MIKVNNARSVMDEFVGKVVLITGAGRGLGRELSLGFSSLGALIAANDINPVNLDETVSQVSQAGGTARGFVFDIAKRMPIEGMVSQVLDHFGRIDILVNHASVEPEAPLLEMDEWDFHRTLDVNLGGPFFCLQLVGRSMRKLGGGVMVNLISTSGQASVQMGRTAHFASQAGLAGLTRTAAQELFIHNIRLNAVCQGAGMQEIFVPPQWDPGAYRQWKVSLPLSPAGKYPESVSLVLFLCSSAASSLTGQLIPVG